MSRLHRRRMAGLTLVEMMIALTLGLIVIAALVGVFITSNRSYRQNEAIAAMQDNARFALDALGRDIAMAGFWGGVRPIDAADRLRLSTSALVGGDCGAGTTVNLSSAIIFRDHRQALAGAAGDFSCLTVAELQADSDIVLIRRLSGDMAMERTLTGTTGELTVNRVYVKTNRNAGTLFRATTTNNFDTATDCVDAAAASSGCVPSAPSPADTTPVQVFAYTPQVYYVRSRMRAAEDGSPIPGLCRRFLNDTVNPPVMQEDCLAEGVERLQIEWGIGTGQVERYTSTPTVAELDAVVTARIHLVVRSTALQTRGSTDNKTFTLANLDAYTPTDSVLRRAYSTTVQLKNYQP